MTALYIRVSSEMQVLEGYSLRAQEETLIEYCEANKITDYKIYRDEGCSAHQAYNKRPVMMALLSDVENGLINKILFIKLDRWMRDVKEYHKVQEILDRHGCTWRAVTEDYETETANGRFTVNIMLSVAQNEAERTSERIKLTNISKIKHGEPVSGQPVGYKIVETPDGKRIGIDEEAADKIRWLVREYIETRSTTKTLIHYNEKYGEQRSYTWIRLLFNRIHLYNGRHELNPTYRPRILSDEEIAKVQELKSVPVKERHRRGIKLFSGLVICPRCGYPMTAHNHKSKYTGKYTYYYFCQRKSYHRGCDYSLYFRESLIEEYLLDHLPAEIDAEYELRRKAKEKPDESKKDAEKLKERLRRLNKMYELGTIEDEQYEAGAKEIKAKLADIERKKPLQLRPEALEEIRYADIKGMYELLDRENKAAFWHKYIHSIHVHPTDRKVLSIRLV